MNPSLRFAAIDIGSNAVRLLLSAVTDTDDTPVFRKMSLMRMPLRLGEEAFTEKRISESKARQLTLTMKGFGRLIEAYQPLDVMACATSAMREAENGEELCHKIRLETGIAIRIIDGQTEAGILFENHKWRHFKGDGPCLHVDVGGGSAELTVFSNTGILGSRSFTIGTVRLLKDRVSKDEWSRMREWLQGYASQGRFQAATGSGGNLNKLFRLSECKKGKPLSRRAISAMLRELKARTVEQRIAEFGLRHDRADVIIPAAEIYLQVMNWAGVKEIYVPMLGLADGMIALLYARYKANQR